MSRFQVWAGLSYYKMLRQQVKKAVFALKWALWCLGISLWGKWWALSECCQTWSWVNSQLSWVKLIYWHWVVKKESTAFVSGVQARKTGISCAKGWNTLMAFREKIFKGNVREGATVCDHVVHNSQIGCNGGEISSTTILLVSTGLRCTWLWSAVFNWCGSVSYENKSGMCVRLLCLSGNRGFHDSAMWLVYSINCYQFPSPTSILGFYIFTFSNH